MCVCVSVSVPLPSLPPSFPSPSRFLPPLYVCSGEAVVAGWRRTWWPRQEKLQEKESSDAGGEERGGEGIVPSLCSLSTLPLLLLASPSIFILFLEPFSLLSLHHCF